MADGIRSPAKERKGSDLPTDFRPQSLVRCLSKLHEDVLKARLEGVLEGTGGGLSNAQYGFRRGKSAVQAVMRIKELVRNATGR